MKFIVRKSEMVDQLHTTHYVMLLNVSGCDQNDQPTRVASYDNEIELACS